MPNIRTIEKLSKLIRYFIITATTKAGSGHPSSSLSAVELMATLFFGGFFRFDALRHKYPNNDRLIFSKGHAAPLLYSLWAAVGKVTPRELMRLRTFRSPFEGHPSVSFPFTEAATGSLGQGLSIGVGMALNAKYLDKLSYRTFVLLGDSEMSEGSQWEALAIAAHYKLNNLIGILDVNRLGQRGPTMYGHNVDAYRRRVASFGWKTIVLDDGHSILPIVRAYREALSEKKKPVMIIAKTVKGKGVKFIENKNGWHGRALSVEQSKKALATLGDVSQKLRGSIAKPHMKKPRLLKVLKKQGVSRFQRGELVATRKAYGNALLHLAQRVSDLVVLDGEVSNSTFAQTFARVYPQRFFEMFIAEQNMVGVATGLALRGKLPFVSTFAAFLTRAFDQIRMSAYSKAHIVFVGSHAGVAVGEDGPSQMGLEDIAMMRSVFGSTVLYPTDAVSTVRLVEAAAKAQGIVYLRTTRNATPVIYSSSEHFPIGGSKVLRKSRKDKVAIVGAGITLHEALAVYDALKKEGIFIRVIDLYSIKPIDTKTLKAAARETSAILTVEDHVHEGGIGEAVRSALKGLKTPMYSLAVGRVPTSGKPVELLSYEGISQEAILKNIRAFLST